MLPTINNELSLSFGGSPNSRFCYASFSHLLAACVFGHCFSSLTHSVFSEFTRQEKTNSCLDLSWRDGRLLVVVSQTGSFSGDSLEDVVHEGVHDTHGFAGNTIIWMNLLHNFVEVDGVTLFTLASSFLVSTDSTFLAGLLPFGCYWFGRHDVAFLSAFFELPSYCRSSTWEYENENKRTPIYTESQEELIRIG